MEYVLTEFYKLKALPRESPENFILRLNMLITKNYQKTHLFNVMPWHGIRAYYLKLVESIESSKLITKELLNTISGLENEIINDGLFEKLINFYKINKQREWNC